MLRESDADGELEIRLVDEMTALAARLRLAAGRLDRRVRIDGRETVAPLQLSVLFTLEEHGPQRMSELAAREAVSISTMSRLLGKLGDRALVEREVDPGDARAVVVSLSQAGAAEVSAVRSTGTALVARRLRTLGPEQRDLIAAAMPALEALLVDERPAEVPADREIVVWRRTPDER